MSDVVLSERRDACLRLTINRPEVHNAINEAVCAALTDALEAVENDRELRAVVITGAGEDAFCAGGDLRPGTEGTPFAVDPADPNHYVVKLLRRMERSRVPIVARVNGVAAAGGLGIVCAADLAVAADHARFGVPETRVGLFPMMILPHMARVIPRRRLFELCITADLIDAQAALAANIVNHVVPAAELDSRCDWLLERIISRSPTAIRLGKQAFRAIEDMTLDQGLEYTQLMLPMMSTTRDAREGFAAFNEKRSPTWTGE